MQEGDVRKIVICNNFLYFIIQDIDEVKSQWKMQITKIDFITGVV